MSDAHTTRPAWLSEHQAALMPSLGVPQRKLVRGQGCHVWDSEGKKYTDLLGGIAVNALGHAHPDLVKAVTNQLLTLGHVSNYFANDPQVRLAQRLLELTGAQGGAVYFANSGAEANEAALKMARRAGGDDPGKKKIIAVEGAFHGRTLGALSVTHKPDYREPFNPLIPEVEFVPFGDTDALKAAVDEHTAAVIIEPIQGEAGVSPHPQGYLRAVREATSAVEALMILDEVQTGIARTGAMFAFQHPELGEGIIPDVITLAKGLGGGIPIGATVTLNERATGLLKPGQHGSTYSGNPVATAAGLAVLDVIERDGLIAHVSELGQRFEQQLAQQPGVSSVRGAGLLLAAELTDIPAAAFNVAALEHGFIINPVTQTHIRIAPPLTVTAADLDAFIHAFDTILSTAANA